MPGSTETQGALLALSNDLAAAVERVGRSVVAIHARKRIPASGVHWRAGVIVAANHTIRKDEDITVTVAGGRTLAATLAGRDATTDIAVLRLDAKDLAAAEIGDSGSVKVGHLVLAVGRPGDEVTASLGVVSAVGDEFRTWAGGTIDRFIRLDLSIYDGFSGGALVDGAGRVIGLNSSGLARGMALTIPAATVDRVAAQLLERGHIARGYVGLGMQPVRLGDAQAAKLGLDRPGGVLVMSVEPGGPAEKSGVLLGDVLVALDGAPVADTTDVLAILGADRIGQSTRARIVRGGALTELALSIGERPRRG
jgi:S1-C subfamily serine protease